MNIRYILTTNCVHTDYFAKHMGDYEGVLASLETLNLSILKAMDFTKKVIVCVFYTFNLIVLLSLVIELLPGS